MAIDPKCFRAEHYCKAKPQSHAMFFPFSDAMFSPHLVIILTFLAMLRVQALPGPQVKVDEDDIQSQGRLEGDTVETTTEDMGTGPPVETGEPVGPTLGAVLSKFTYVVMVGYVLGISWKLFKIYKGEYEAEEPIYLKYK